MICSEYYVENPCLDEILMVTFEIIATYFVHLEIVKKNNSLEFNIDGYEDLKVVLLEWPTFLDRY